jgi:hypothetical protein
MGNQRSAVTKLGSSRPTHLVASKPALPTAANSHPILKLQKMVGNRAVQRLIESQFKGSAQETNEAPGMIVNAALTSPGNGLDAATRALMESSFGSDFSGVRVHTGALAAESAAAIRAHAYTSGKDIVFAEERYAPGTPEGQRLLAHELAHVEQQGSGPVAGTTTADGSLSISDPGDSYEQAADARAEQVIDGGTREATQPAGEAAPGVSVQRQDDDNSNLDTAATVAGVPHAGAELVEGAQATGEAVENAEKVVNSFQGPTLQGIFGALPETVTAAAEGSPSLADTASAVQVSQASGAGALGGVPGATLGNALAPLALGAGIYDDTKAIEDMSQHGANLENTPELVQGTLEATSGGIGTLGLAGAGLSAAGATGAGGTAAGLAAAAAPVGMVAGAGALGMLAGKGMADVADSSLTKTGAFGVDQATGQNQSAMDWGANWGTKYDKWAGNTDPSVMGGIAAGVGGIVGGIGGAAYGGYNWLKQKL